MVSKVICILALRTKVASALEGLKYSIKASQASLNPLSLNDAITRNMSAAALPQ